MSWLSRLANVFRSSTVIATWTTSSAFTSTRASRT